MCDVVGIINKGKMEAFGKLEDITDSMADKKTYVIELGKETRFSMLNQCSTIWRQFLM